MLNRLPQAPTSTLMPTPVRTTAFPIEDDLMFGTPKEGSLVSLPAAPTQNSTTNLHSTGGGGGGQRRPPNAVPSSLMSKGGKPAPFNPATASVNSSSGNASMVSVTRIGGPADSSVVGSPPVGNNSGILNRPSISMNPAGSSRNLAGLVGNNSSAAIIGASRGSSSAPTVVNHQHFTATYLPRNTTNMFGCLFTEDIRADLKGIIETIPVGFYNANSNGSELAFSSVQQQLAGRDSTGNNNNSVSGEGAPTGIGRGSNVGLAPGAQSPTNQKSLITMKSSSFNSKSKSAPQRIFAAIAKTVAKSDEVADEWMYELKNKQARSPFDLISAVMEAAMDGDWAAVAKCADDRSATKTSLEESLMLPNERQTTAVVEFGEQSVDDSSRQMSGVELGGGGTGIITACLAPLFTVLSAIQSRQEGDQAEGTKTFHPLTGTAVLNLCHNNNNMNATPANGSLLVFPHQLMLAPTLLDRAARRSIAQQLLVKIAFGASDAATRDVAGHEQPAFGESMSLKPSYGFEEATELAVGAHSRGLLLTELYCWLRLGKYLCATNGDEAALAEALNLAVA
eukprot:GILJ01016974.1.p2 GENE.GILJ01016974.1~~GILJ01016974.1.p2  ORF type:complete len:566 (+),score=114.77 GILJ01016974.1:2051-3748(+)